MRWERLFADLQAQVEAAESAELAGEVAERTRIEVGAIVLADRLRAALGQDVLARCIDGQTVAGPLRQVGPDWLLIGERPDREALLPLAALVSVAGLGPFAAPADGGVVAGRLDLRYALRGLARDRAGVAVSVRGGDTVGGTIDRVGRDFVEVAEHPVGEPRRRGAVRRARLIALAAVVVVRTAG